MVYIKANYGRGETEWGHMTRRKMLRFGPLASRSEFDEDIGVFLADLFNKAWHQCGGRGLIEAIPVPELTFEEWCKEIEGNEWINAAYFGKYVESGGIEEMKLKYLQCISTDEIIQGELDSWED